MSQSRYRALAPNVVTAGNIVAGFLAMVAAADGRFELSVYLLALAVTLDILDGLVARVLGATSEFGREMDSFSDLLSFGAAPALLAYLACLHGHGALGVVAAILYVLAAVARLTRFNLTTDAHDKEARTTGVPVPIAAGYVMAMVLMRDRLPWTGALLVLLVFAALMVSRLRLPTLKGRNIVTATLLVGIVNYFVVVFHPNWYTIGWWNVWNVVILMVAHSRDRRVELDSASPDFS